MLAREIIEKIENVAPLSEQERWDNSGLQIGQRDKEVSSALLCTDVSEAIIDEAIDKGCQMIISHHPLLFHGLKQIEGNTWQERCTIKAIKNDIVIYSSHTAMDCYIHGVSGHIAEKLGINDYTLLYPNNEEYGLGVVGELPEPLLLEDLLSEVKRIFQVPVIKYTVNKHKDTISRVAICGGAGAEFTEMAIKAGADAYISADFKYHDFQNAEGRIAILDIGHFESEQFTKEIFSKLLSPYITCYFADNDKSDIKVF